MKVRRNECKQIRIYNPQPEVQVNPWYDREGDAV